MKILVAEDEIFQQKAISNFCKKLNIDIDLANDGQEAVDMAKATEYNMILMDLNMPKMDGYQATEIIRKLPNGLNYIIIALSADDVKDEIIKKYGFNGAVNKPMPKSKFESLIDLYRIPK